MVNQNGCSVKRAATACPLWGSVVESVWRSLRGLSCVLTVACAGIVVGTALPADAWGEIDPIKCRYAQAKLGDEPMVCHDRTSFLEQANASGLYYRKSLGAKDVFDVPDLFPLVAKLVSLYNDDDVMVMAQFIFPANDADNSYRKIRLALDKKYGVGKRVVGFERSPVFEYKWHLRDGVVVSFKRRKGASNARLTYSRPHMARAFLSKQGYQPSRKQRY